MNALVQLTSPRYTRLVKDARIDAEDYAPLPAAPQLFDAFESFVAVAYLRHLISDRNEARAALATMKRSLVVGAEDAAPVPLTPDLDEESRCVHCGRPLDDDCECWTQGEAP
jgi:hypothetical protein